MDIRSLLPFARVTTSAGTDPYYAMRRDMERMFDDASRGWPNLPTAKSGAFLSPAVDVSETDKGLVFQAELPGIDPKDVHVELVDGTLTIAAERKYEKDENDDKKHMHLKERAYGTFLRRFDLPFNADPSKVAAAFDKGVLKVEVPRPPAAEKKAAKIEVKAG
ncbi:MAG: Hsp20 family protein [Alphaproteobacteria bacterium]|nr:Hsp20 family protein [Alphaproteobacteria bacterium]